jgi:hypothetical protein
MKLGVDKADNPSMKSARCFMQKQLGYLINHKCNRAGATCNTGITEGFSYLVGCANILLVHGSCSFQPNFLNVYACCPVHQPNTW